MGTTRASPCVALPPIHHCMSPQVLTMSLPKKFMLQRDEQKAPIDKTAKAQQSGIDNKNSDFFG